MAAGLKYTLVAPTPPGVTLASHTLTSMVLLSSVTAPLRAKASTGHNVCAVIQGDALERENISMERGVCTEGRGTPDLPEHVATVRCATSKGNRCAARRRERTPYLENPDASEAVPLRVSSRSSERRRHCQNNRNRPGVSAPTDLKT